VIKETGKGRVELRTEKVCMYFEKETTSAERNPEVSIAQKGNEVRRLAYFPSHSEYSNTGLPVMRATP
jgi:hypothetical protein